MNQEGLGGGHVPAWLRGGGESDVENHHLQYSKGLQSFSIVSLLNFWPCKQAASMSGLISRILLLYFLIAFTVEIKCGMQQQTKRPAST